MDLAAVQQVSAAMGVPLLSGANLFVTVATLGGVQYFLDKPIPGLEALAQPAVIIIGLAIYAIETCISPVYNFFTPSVPIDTVKESVKTFVVIPAAAVMTGLVLAADAAPPELEACLMGFDISPRFIAGLFLGGSLAATTHFLKIFVRSMIDLLPEPVSNLLAELGEGAASFAGVLLITFAPVIAIGCSLVFLVLFIIFGPRVYRSVLATWSGIFGGLRYLRQGRKSSPCDPAKIRPRHLDALREKAGYAPGDTVCRAHTDRAPGLGGNRDCYLVLKPGKIWLVCFTLFGAKPRAIRLADVEEAIYKVRLLYNYLELREKGEKKPLAIKFLKTRSADGEAVARRAGAIEAGPVRKKREARA